MFIDVTNAHRKDRISLAFEATTLAAIHEYIIQLGKPFVPGEKCRLGERSTRAFVTIENPLYSEMIEWKEVPQFQVLSKSCVWPSNTNY